MRPRACSLLVICSVLGVSVARPRDPAHMLARQTAATCASTDTYSAPNNLTFTSHCNQDIARAAYRRDALIEDTSFTECMNTCSTSNLLCYGIAFTERNSSCSLLTNGTFATEENLTSDSNTDIALVDPPSQLAAVDTSCPFANDTVHSTDSGLNFSVQCYTDLTPYTHYCPWDIPAARDGEKWCVPNTESLAECMDLCASAHPLCRAVTWNPDLGNGFGNCYLKDFGNGTGTLVDGAHSRYTIHAALAVVPEIEAGSCPAQLNYSATGVDGGRGGKEFELRCYESRTATGNLTSLHVGSVEGCMDRCAEYEGGSECVGVVFDSSMLSGYENCVLLSDLGETSGNVNSTFAQVVSTSNSGGNTPGGSSSKAWIAGPVVGGVAGLVVLGLAAWWWRRWKKKRNEVAVKSATPLSSSPESESKPAIWANESIGRGQRFAEVEARPPQYELEAPSSQPRTELPGP